MSTQMARMLNASRPERTPDQKPILEVNAEHALVKAAWAFSTGDDTRFADLAHIPFDQAMLAEAACRTTRRLRQAGECVVGGSSLPPGAAVQALLSSRCDADRDPY